MGARSPECNKAWIPDPAFSKHLSSKRDAGVDQKNMSPRNVINLYTNPHWLGFKLLKAFINHLLSTIHHNNLTEILNTDCWGLEGNEDGFINLDNWDSRQASQEVYKMIVLPVINGLGTLTPIYPQWVILGGLWPSRVKFIQLPNREIFEIRELYLLLVIYYQMRLKGFKKKTRIEKTRNSILISTDLKVVDLMKVFKGISNVSGFFEIPNSSSNIRTTDTRTVTDLGWRHGTELRLEMLWTVLKNLMCTSEEALPLARWRLRQFCQASWFSCLFAYYLHRTVKASPSSPSFNYTISHFTENHVFPFMTTGTARSMCCQSADQRTRSPKFPALSNKESNRIFWVLIAITIFTSVSAAEPDDLLKHISMGEEAILVAASDRLA